MPADRPHIEGLRADGSLGVRHYADRLARALADLGINYRPREWAPSDHLRHFHLANSSRTALSAAAGRGEPYVLTIHDVLPRTPALVPVYRAWVWPWIVRRAAAVIVHSEHARQLLAIHAREDARVVFHPVSTPAVRDRSAARALLGWGPGAPIVVMPGVAKASKLSREAILACAPLITEGLVRCVIAGRVSDPALRAAATRAGLTMIESPSTPIYQAAIVAADLVLVLRSGSVGEANGPLADALGAGRAVVATRSGSIPEHAGDAAIFTEPDVESIRAAILAAIPPAEQSRLEALSRGRRAALNWSRAARQHLEIFSSVWGPLSPADLV